jgi:hypothetical protein
VTSIGVFQPTLYQATERKFAHDFIIRAVIGLTADQIDHDFFGSAHKLLLVLTCGEAQGIAPIHYIVEKKYRVK